MACSHRRDVAVHCRCHSRFFVHGNLCYNVFLVLFGPIRNSCTHVAMTTRRSCPVNQTSP